jgi:hypothetical protein
MKFVALLASLMMMMGTATACINGALELAPTPYERAVRSIERAEFALKAGDYKNAYTIAHGLKTGNDTLRERGMQVCAMALIRSRGAVASKDKDERVRRVKSAAKYLYGIARANPDDPRHRANYAEAMALFSNTWRAALVDLEDLAARDLLSDPAAEKVLAQLRAKAAVTETEPAVAATK